MESLVTISFALSLIAYSVSGTQFFLALARSQTGAVTPDSQSHAPPGSFGPVSAPMVLTSGAILHALYILVASLFTNTCPVQSLHFSLSLAGLVSVVVFLVIRRGRRLDPIGGFVAPLALTFLVTAQFVGEIVPPPEISRPLLTFHIASNLIGLGFVLLGGACAAFYVFVESRLKAKRLLSVGRLPSLDVLDRAAHRMLLLGFPLLTIGVVSGGMFIAQMDVSSAASVARTVLGYAAWLVVAVVLGLRAVLGWSGRRSAYGTLVGVVGVSLVLGLYLVRAFLGAML